jgi:hypothetical protein
MPPGGPRRSAFYYDLWNIKYLSKFKWDHLTEELGAHTPTQTRTHTHVCTRDALTLLPASSVSPRAAYQKAVKEQKMALELSAATRERDFYMKQVDHGKAIAAMSAKQQRRAEVAAAAAEAGDGAQQAQQVPPAGGAGGGGGKGGGKSRMVRTFQQVRRCRCGGWLLARMPWCRMTWLTCDGFGACVCVRSGRCARRLRRRACLTACSRPSLARRATARSEAAAAARSPSSARRRASEPPQHARRTPKYQ